MHLPVEVQEKIDFLIKDIPLTSLMKEWNHLSSSYREKGHALLSERQRFAYLMTRLPATYAALMRVFTVLYPFTEQEPPLSLLDVGAGPGTVLLGALEVFNGIKQSVCVEQDPGFIALGKQLVGETLGQTWLCCDLKAIHPFPRADLVTACYSLGELKPLERMVIAERLFAATQKWLVLIEPGTPRAFDQMKEIREGLIRQGGHLIAPCPHMQDCPLKEGDWCHFPARVERSSWHRQMKGATLNYEDEKFFYLIFSKTPVQMGTARVISQPLQGKGHIKLRLCTSNGIEEIVVSRKDKESFHFSKKISWGDSYKKTQDVVK